MNPDLARLQPYPFEKLAQLKAGLTPPPLLHIALSIGEPRHPAPAFAGETVHAHLDTLSTYPTTYGRAQLRAVIADWLTARFGLPAGRVDPDANVLPVCGTREALFACAQCMIDRRADPLVALPNPFYQIYEGAALLAGAQPWYLNTPANKDLLAAVEATPEAVWERCQLLYICSPANPNGSVLDEPSLIRLIELAHRHEFVIAADECYSEVYLDESHPPPGLLGAAARGGYDDFARCMVFHSLSKRSNLAGMRSGFVAGDASIIERFRRYRTYYGCAMPLAHQMASEHAWRDEAHVRENRARYREKFEQVLEILAPVLDVDRPAGGFYLWPRVPFDDETFARRLFAEQHVTVLPGRYLSRPAHGADPGQGRVRIALVAELEECVEAARRIRSFVEHS